MHNKQALKTIAFKMWNLRLSKQGQVVIKLYKHNNGNLHLGCANLSTGPHASRGLRFGHGCSKPAMSNRDGLL